MDSSSGSTITRATAGAQEVARQHFPGERHRWRPWRCARRIKGVLPGVGSRLFFSSARGEAGLLQRVLQGHVAVLPWHLLHPCDHAGRLTDGAEGGESDCCFCRRNRGSESLGASAGLALGVLPRHLAVIALSFPPQLLVESQCLRTKSLWIRLRVLTVTSGQIKDI